MAEITLKEASQQSGVTQATLRRWAQAGVIPAYRGRWTTAAATHARIVKRLRERGHSLELIKREGEQGRLAFAFVEEIFPPADANYTVADIAKRVEMEPALVERVYKAAGFNPQMLEELSEADAQLFDEAAEVLGLGFPLVAFLQMVKVYGQSLAQVADAEVRLFQMYVHEPMIRAGVEGSEMATGMEQLVSELLPKASRIIEHLHQRFLQEFIEQNIVFLTESNVDDQRAIGRLPIAIAFADLAGYTRLTEEEGEELAFDAVERFMSAVEHTLPKEARVLKTIGDEVMIVGSDANSLTDWAVSFQATHRERPRPRIGIHYGETLYRDGDYFGREVNQAARVAARAAGGEVLVTRPIVELAEGELEFELIGEVSLKGFSDSTELFLARRSPGQGDGD